MPSLDLTRKSMRVVEFFAGMTKPKVKRAMSLVGFAERHARDGYARLGQVLLGSVDVAPPVVERDPKILAQLDALENRWFEVAGVTLKYNFPEAHEHVFRNLAQAEGAEVIVSMSTFMRRIDSLVAENVPNAREALALLAERGLDESVFAQIRGLLAELTAIPTPAPVASVTDEELARREEALWNWYKEWSVIARRGISDRNVLRALGFLKGDRFVDDEDESEGESEGGGEGAPGGSDGGAD